MNEQYLYAYDLTIWNDIDGKDERVRGIAWAGTWSDLFMQLGKYYGDEDISEVHNIQCLTDSTTGVIELDKNIYQQLVDYDKYL